MKPSKIASTAIGLLSIWWMVFNRRRRLSGSRFTLLLLLALAELCMAGERPAALPCAQWTLAFYLAGDNSLESAQARNLREIIKGAAYLKETHVVVFMDRNDSFDHENPLTSWKGTRVFHVAKPFNEVLRRPLSTQLPLSIGKNRFEELVLAQLKDLKERQRVEAAYHLKGGRYLLGDFTAEQRQDLLTLLTDRADYLLPMQGHVKINLPAAAEKTLRQFCCFVGDNFPARRYALFMAGHGSGWYEKDFRPVPAGRKQVSAEYYQTLKSSTLSAAARWQHFDLIAMDSCLMADMETLWALKDAADFLVLNQIETPSQGLDYTLLLKKTGALPAPPLPRQLARAVVNAYALTYGKKPYPVATAAFESAYIEHAAQQWNHFFRDAKNARRLPPALSRLTAIPTATALRGAMADLRSLCRLLGLVEMDAAFFGPGGVMVDCFLRRTSGSGLSIYLPKEKAVFQQTITAYRNTPWARAFPSGWVRGVEDIFSNLQKKGPTGSSAMPHPQNP